MGKSMHKTLSFIEERMVSMVKDLSVLTDAVDLKLDAVNMEISVLKRAISNAVSSDGVSSSKLRVVRLSDAEKFFMESSLLVGDAKLWWRSHVSGDAQAELRSQGIKDLPSAFAVVNGLVDFGGIEVQSSKIKQRNEGKEVENSSKGDFKKIEMGDEKTPTSVNKSRKGCFTCWSGDHRMLIFQCEQS
ncbi:hypothetical protein BUALT_Bualt19G0038700 [Buddleja alternifolia]|uniref:Uncharacterized protein n=1 Tax=Buddleja alternifolia TaxID=168488 RepID=A0AAV6W9E2_9LAMI|nr:hypothetical protein BUALT_Bualt19G0038700 [Buddleja alternifolia]